ncbi:MAG: tetraacyldisaccharide 4-kinase [Burkholderiales bacterium]|jgi:tetraacyldisaccharide 4'-kinase|nr:tetraacyldisaccharide 4-kinase [Burkholderiales bacterium]
MNLQKLIENHWYVKTNPLLTIILIIPTLLFFIISKIRYYLYKFKFLSSYKLPVPVVIIGNISVGGVGKTPLTKMLALHLSGHSRKVGIIMRGYKSQNKGASIVYADSKAFEVGDEALIYATNGLRVAIGRDRYEAGLKLLKTYPDIDLILADDGLQHYRLQRDFEIAVVDATRLFNNTFVLPMGPLRETMFRLNSVDAIVSSGYNTRLKQYADKLYIQETILDKIYNPVNRKTVSAEYFSDKIVTAMAAMGNPGKFFDLLHQCGIQPKQQLIYPDHHYYKFEDIPKDSLILVTEKDYTKLARFNNPNIYIVYVKTKLDNDDLLGHLVKLNQ